MASRAIELSEKGDELVIAFAYRAELVLIVRALSQRRFDRLTKSWSSPVEIVTEVVETLVEHGFVISPAVRELYRARGGTLALGDSGGAGALPAGTAAIPSAGIDGGGAALLTDRPKLVAAPAAADGSPPSLSISELNQRVKRLLARSFPEMLWVVGEIVGFDKNRHRPHVHFQLMEKQGEGASGGASSSNGGGAGFSGGGAIKASVDAVLFARTRAEIERKLAASDAPFELRDGIEVRLGVRVDLYEAKGAFQLIVEEIDPVHTLGKIAQNRAAVLAELEKKGLREKNAALPWPEVPLRVGLITSVGSDAYNDFVNELQRSGYSFAITVADARMQGQGLERGLLAALAWFRERANEFDALAIVRGGGAKGDLIWFDNLQVALAVATCPIKVISGIGHQRDVSVIDLIAHPEKTPTAAAAALVVRVQAFEQRLANAFAALADAVQARVTTERDRIGRCVRELAQSARSISRLGRERLRAALARIAPAARERLRAARRTIAETRMRLAALGRAQSRLQANDLDALRRRLDLRALALHLERRATRLAALDQLAQSLHPRRVLRRGFAIVKDASGRTLRDAAAVAPGGNIVATLAIGRLHARVERRETETGAPPGVT